MCGVLQHPPPGKVHIVEGSRVGVVGRLTVLGRHDPQAVIAGEGNAAGMILRCAANKIPASVYPHHAGADARLFRRASGAVDMHSPPVAERDKAVRRTLRHARPAPDR